MRKKIIICASLWASATWMACDGGGPQQESPPGAPASLATEQQALQCNLGSMSLSAVPANQRLGSSACGTKVGFSVGSGDSDGDGKSDIVVGAPGGSTGSVCLVRGNGPPGMVDIRTVSSKFLGDSAPSASRLGSSVVLGDFGSSPKPEFLAGGPGYSGSKGAVYAVDGDKLFSPPPLTVYKYAGAANNDETGAALATGDLTDDGLSDLIVGAPLGEYNGGATGIPVNSGMVYVVKNTRSALNNINLYSTSPNIFRIQNLPSIGSQTDLKAGTSVAVVDVNGDNKGDLVVGVPGYDNGSLVDAGAVFIFYGPLTGNRSLGIADVILVGSVAGGLAGTSLAQVKDLGGSGKDALLVGAPGSGTTLAGHAYLASGLTTKGTFSLSGHTIFEGTSGDLAGTSVASGDFDGDGKPDLLIGAPGTAGNRGAAFLVYGNQTLMPSNNLTAFTRFDGELAGDQAGWSVASAGDFNGDGVSDFLVGAPGYSGGQGVVYLILGQGQHDWYPDQDGDGHGDKKASAKRDCVSPTPGHWVQNHDDCDDSNANINPDMPELCATKGIDDNCDGLVDDSTASDAPLWCKDADHDLHADLFTPLQQSCLRPGLDWILNDDRLGDECNDPDSDKDPGTNADALEACDGRDNNCNGAIDEGADTIWYADVDRDGFGSDKEFFPYHAGCAFTPGPFYVNNKLDCNDRDPSLNPNTPWYLDRDGDGVGNSVDPPVHSCEKPPGNYVRSGDDCNDSDPKIRPGIPEVCEDENAPQIDNNCNGTPDDTYDAPTWFEDKDGDGFGSSVQLGRFCGRPPKGSKLTGDCDDTQPKSFPGNIEVCEVNPSDPYAYVLQIDNNCIGGVDDTTEARWWYGDGDKDGYRGTTFRLRRCTNPSGDDAVYGKYLLDDAPLDCNDADPGATQVKMWYPDTDHDGCGNPNQGISSCYNPSAVCGAGATYVTVSGPGCI